VLIWPTVLQLWRFRGCLNVSFGDVLLQSNYYVRRCACLKRWLTGWQRQDNVGANFALLVVQTNWCLPITPPPIPPFPFSSSLFPLPSLFYLLTSSFATFNYAFRLSVVVTSSCLYSKVLIPVTPSLFYIVTSTLTVRVAFNSAHFRF